MGLAIVGRCTTQIENHIHNGRLKDYVRRCSRSPTRADRRHREGEKDASKNDKPGSLILGKPAGKLNFLIRGFAGGGVTISARKKYQRSMFRVSEQEDNDFVEIAQS